MPGPAGFDLGFDEHHVEEGVVAVLNVAEGDVEIGIPQLRGEDEDDDAQKSGSAVKRGTRERAAAKPEFDSRRFSDGDGHAGKRSVRNTDNICLSADWVWDLDV